MPAGIPFKWFYDNQLKANPDKYHLLVKGTVCKLHNNKYIITSTKITNSETFAFLAVLVFKLLSRKVLFINRKNNRSCYKRLLFKKTAKFPGKLLQN